MLKLYRTAGTIYADGQSGWVTRAYVVNGVCLRSLLVDVPSGTIVEQHGGGAMVDTMARKSVEELKEFGFTYRMAFQEYHDASGNEFLQDENGDFTACLNDADLFCAKANAMIVDA